MRMVDLIIKKRDGHELTDEEIRFWIDGYVKGEIPDYQSSAMQMAILFKGMTHREVSTLTDAMEHSGETLDLSMLKGVKVDKHSTGGVGDKTTLVLGPMVASCGATLAKLSGRGLGHTGGTLDKLESIPGLTIAISGQRFIDQVNSIGIAVAGQTKSLVPADKKMYALRDVTGTVESIPLIAASVMSKKLASGSDAILLDVTVGEGAFMKNMKDARELATIMVQIGNHLGRDTRAVLSDMSEPLGLAVGNSLEVKEAIAALHGHGPEDLMELCYTAGSIMLVQAHCAENKEVARQKLVDSINSGRAFEKFCQMVEAQGGDLNYILHPELFEVSKNILDVTSDKEGYVQSIDALEIGESSMRLGGGRATLDDVIDMSAGIVLNKKVGDFVKKGEKLCTVYTNKTTVDYQPVLSDIKKSFVVSEKPIEHIHVIREIIEL
ncbi:MAG: pyrimidine-nucleoside phosphorylase [Erysipelotrichaceae bacterium]|nr:pyrimidine-nucleoside phosphorylase [Erysipelotrichaceae bacterium]